MYVLNHPGSRYQGKKKNPWCSLQQSPASQVVAEGTSEDRPGKEKRGQDRAPSPLPPRGELLQAGVWQPVQTGPAKEEFSCFTLAFCLFFNTNSISQ